MKGLTLLRVSGRIKNTQSEPKARVAMKIMYVFHSTVKVSQSSNDIRLYHTSFQSRWYEKGNGKVIHPKKSDQLIHPIVRFQDSPIGRGTQGGTRAANRQGKYFGNQTETTWSPGNGKASDIRPDTRD